MESEPSKVGKRGTVVIPAALRRRYGIKEGAMVIAEGREDGVLIRPAVILPVEVYTPERNAQFLLSTAVDRDDYEDAVGAVRAMGLDPPGFLTTSRRESDEAVDRVFLDANVLLFAALRPKAGLLRLWTLANAALITSDHAIEESRRNLDAPAKRAVDSTAAKGGGCWLPLLHSAARRQPPGEGSSYPIGRDRCRGDSSPDRRLGALRPLLPPRDRRCPDSATGGVSPAW